MLTCKHAGHTENHVCCLMGGCSNLTEVNASHKGTNRREHFVKAYLKNEKPVVVKINAFALQQLGDFREVAFLLVNIIVRAIVAMCSTGHSELGVWNKLKGLWPLQCNTIAEHTSWSVATPYCHTDGISSSKHTVSMMSWKCTPTLAMARFLWLVEL